MTLVEKIYETKVFLEEKGLVKPEFGLILGSGLGELAQEVENAMSSTMQLFRTGANQRLLVMLVSWFTVIWQDVRS